MFFVACPVLGPLLRAFKIFMLTEKVGHRPFGWWVGYFLEPRFITHVLVTWVEMTQPFAAPFLCWKLSPLSIELLSKFFYGGTHAFRRLKFLTINCGSRKTRVIVLANSPSQQTPIPPLQSHIHPPSTCRFPRTVSAISDNSDITNIAYIESVQHTTRFGWTCPRQAWHADFNAASSVPFSVEVGSDLRVPPEK